MTVLSLDGAFDVDARKSFDEAMATIEGERTPRLIVDLRGVTFIDSSGLRMLLELWAASRNKGVSMAVVRGRPEVQSVLELTGADEVLPMVDAPPR